MTFLDFIRWTIAALFAVAGLSALAEPKLGKRNALSMGFAISIGMGFCLTHLLGGAPTLARAIDAFMLATVCLSAGALFGQAYRMHRAERTGGPTAPKATAPKVRLKS